MSHSPDPGDNFATLLKKSKILRIGLTVDDLESPKVDPLNSTLRPGVCFSGHSPRYSKSLARERRYYKTILRFSLALTAVAAALAALFPSYWLLILSLASPVVLVGVAGARWDLHKSREEGDLAKIHFIVDLSGLLTPDEQSLFSKQFHAACAVAPGVAFRTLIILVSDEAGDPEVRDRGIAVLDSLRLKAPEPTPDPERPGVRSALEDLSDLENLVSHLP